MSDGFNILAVAYKAHDFMHNAAGYLFQICRVGGIWFLLKPAGYWRDRQGNFKMGRGLGGILAGYLNYWRRSLPIYVIRQLSKCMAI